MAAQDLAAAQDKLAASEARAEQLSSDLETARSAAEEMRREMRNLSAQVRPGFDC